MVFLGERYGALQWGGAAFVLVALLLNGVPEREEEEGEPVRGRRLAVGIAAGIAAMVVMSAGIVMMLVAMRHKSY